MNNIKTVAEGNKLCATLLIKSNGLLNNINEFEVDKKKVDDFLEKLILKKNEIDTLLGVLNLEKKKVDDLLEEVNLRISELTKEELVTKQASKQSTIPCNTIQELCDRISNPNQVAILNRIVTDKDYSKIYLSGYEPNLEQSGKKKYLIGTVKVLGTFNEKKQRREEYDIKLYNEGEPKGMFWCSCADHKFNSTKKNIVCKHICFLICKIAKVLNPFVFENKKMNDEELKQLLTKLTANGDIWLDQTVAKILDKITIDVFKQFIKVFASDECCPICFNDICSNDKPDLLSCPTCKSYIHSECASIWLEQKNTCVMCKSDYWKYYDKVKNGGCVSVKTK